MSGSLFFVLTCVHFILKAAATGETSEVLHIRFQSGVDEYSFLIELQPCKEILNSEAVVTDIMSALSIRWLTSRTFAIMKCTSTDPMRVFTVSCLL